MWILLLLPGSFAAYCGTSSIPYSFEVLPDGGTVLGCARAKCFGYELMSGVFATMDHSFERDDGFLRNDPPQREPFITQFPSTAVCAGAAACANSQWVGGFNHVTNSTITMICCSHPYMSSSVYQGVASLQTGQIFIGGEVPGSDHFDYVSNVVPRSMPGGSISYDVSVSRMSCPTLVSLNGPIPPGLENAASAQQALASQQALAAQQALTVQQVFSGAQGPISPTGVASGGTGGAYGGGSGVGGGFGGGGFGAGFCFTDDTTIELSTGETKRMDELKVTDYIKSPSQDLQEVIYVPVMSWLHRVKDVMAGFIVITTQTGKRLKLSSQHFIYKTVCNSTKETTLVMAEQLKIGDCLLEAEGTSLVPVKIQNLSRLIQQGIYAPLTDKGKIMVNGIAASCYAEVADNILIQSAREHFVSCDESNDLVCEVSTVGSNLLLDMMKLIVPLSY